MKFVERSTDDLEKVRENFLGMGNLNGPIKVQNLDSNNSVFLPPEEALKMAGVGWGSSC